MTGPAPTPEALDPTASQTAGPFFHLGLSHLVLDDALPPNEAGAAVNVRGRVRDGNGAPVKDAVIEIWHANQAGVYDRDARGFGRVYAGDDGRFSFRAVRPGSVAGPASSTQAPHLVILLFMRGLLKQLMTRMYFPGDAANDADPILALVPAARRPTLVAYRPEPDSGDLEWDIVLQGEGETVFFAY